jgi:hypothetical protein
MGAYETRPHFFAGIKGLINLYDSQTKSLPAWRISFKL